METPELAALAFKFLLGYLFGSIPSGLLLTRFAGLGDVRTIGSGNIGATNVLRTGSKGLAALTLLADALKGMIPLALFSAGASCPTAAIALGAFLGHLFPVWLKFKGGKGIATYAGLLLWISWQGLLVFAAVWLAIAALTRYSSLAALLATFAVPVALWFFGQHDGALLFAGLTGLAWFMHRANISRLLNGAESQIGGG